MAKTTQELIDSAVKAIDLNIAVKGKIIEVKSSDKNIGFGEVGTGLKAFMQTSVFGRTTKFQVREIKGKLTAFPASVPYTGRDKKTYWDNFCKDTDEISEAVEAVVLDAYAEASK